jgi:hypothetical protein
MGAGKAKMDSYHTKMFIALNRYSLLIAIKDIRDVVPAGTNERIIFSSVNLQTMAQTVKTSSNLASD